MKKSVLLIIDPQNDFVDSNGSLYIPGAEKGIDAMCKYIEEDNPDHIIITQDTHQVNHIGHSEYWFGNPKPFTKITIDDLDSKKYWPVDIDEDDCVEDYIYDYLSKLPKKTHMIWPKHCIKGSWGHAFPNKLTEELISWSKRNDLVSFEVRQKGEYPNAEMYSAISRIDESEDCLEYNELIKKLSSFDQVYIAGFAKDVCVAWTVKDLLASGKFKNKLVFLKDCMVGLDQESDMLTVFEDGINNHGAVWE